MKVSEISSYLGFTNFMGKKAWQNVIQFVVSSLNSKQENFIHIFFFSTDIMS